MRTGIRGWSTRKKPPHFRRLKHNRNEGHGLAPDGGDSSIVVRVGRVPRTRAALVHACLCCTRPGEHQLRGSGLGGGPVVPGKRAAGDSSTGTDPTMTHRRWETEGLLLENRLASRPCPAVDGRSSALFHSLWITCGDRHIAWRASPSSQAERSADVVQEGTKGSREGVFAGVACPRATAGRLLRGGQEGQAARDHQRRFVREGIGASADAES
jgi:hypothetical protein